MAYSTFPIDYHYRTAWLINVNDWHQENLQLKRKKLKSQKVFSLSIENAKTKLSFRIKCSEEASNGSKSVYVLAFSFF